MVVEYDKVDEGACERLVVRLDGCVDGWVMRVVSCVYLYFYLCACVCVFICEGC